LLRSEGALPDDEVVDNGVGRVIAVLTTDEELGGQYEGLQKLYERFKDKGLVVLGFPSNDFGSQEPGVDSEIKHFCSSKFGVTFPMFSKVQVLGTGRAPVYQFLTSSTGGTEVGWNFEKFLVDRTGHVVGRFESNVKPTDPELVAAVEKALS
jgi:glutathione peroxidase